MSRAAAPTLDHRALLYGGHDELVATAAPFLRESVERGETAVAILSGPRNDALRQALGAASGEVEFRAPEALYDTPVRLLARWAQELADHRGDGRLRVVSEVPYDHGPASAAREWARADALFASAFGHAPLDMLCTYDTSALPDAVLVDARSTHPYLVERGERLANPDYGDPIAFMRALDAAPLAPPAGVVHELAFDEEPVVARRFAAERARMAGLAGERLDDVRVAVTEIATNAVLHGRAPRVVRAWQDGGAIVFEIEDGGAGITSPLTGFLAPSVEATDGRGVWIARRLCDLVEVRGALVRLRFPLA